MFKMFSLQRFAQNGASGYGYPATDSFNQPGGNFQGYGGSFGGTFGGEGASASAAIGPDGIHQTAAVYPENPVTISFLFTHLTC